MLFGHIKERERIKHLVKQNALAPAQLFTGVEGIGKCLVAKETASTLLCEATEVRPCNKCKECRLIAGNNHPDVITVESKDTDRWNLEGIRGLLHTLGLRPYQGKARAIIFNDAEHLSAAAINSLLKSIEEPRPGTYFFVIAQNSNSLLPTLRSRCQAWYFKPLRAVDVTKALKSGYFEELRDNLAHLPLDQITEIANGSLSAIKTLVENFDLWEQCSEDLTAMFLGDVLRAIQVSESFKSEKDRLRIAMGFFRTFAHQKLRSEQNQFKVKLWSNFIFDVLECENLIFKRNLNPVYALNSLFTTLIRNASTEGTRSAA